MFDNELSNWYPGYVGATSATPIQTDYQPLQPTSSPQVGGLMGRTPQSGGHWSTVLWAGGLVIFAVVLMHLAARE
jgi:hypothetical protein